MNGERQQLFNNICQEISYIDNDTEIKRFFFPGLFCFILVVSGLFIFVLHTLCILNYITCMFFSDILTTIIFNLIHKGLDTQPSSEVEHLHT